VVDRAKSAKYSRDDSDCKGLTGSTITQPVIFELLNRPEEVFWYIEQQEGLLEASSGEEHGEFPA
jgi:hypothetical protein